MGARSNLTDAEVVERFNAFMAENPYTTRHKIQLAVGVSIPRMEKMGLKLPLKIHPSDASRMAKKAGGWGKNFKLNGSRK